MQHAEVGQPHGQFPVGAGGVGKDEAMPRAVHGLHAELLFLHVQQEHVLLQTERICTLSIRQTEDCCMSTSFRNMSSCKQGANADSQQKPDTDT